MQFIRNVNGEPAKVNEEVTPTPVVEPISEVKVEEVVATEPVNDVKIVDKKVEDKFAIPVYEQTTFVHNQVIETPNITAQDVSESVGDTATQDVGVCLCGSGDEVETVGVTTAQTEGEQLKFDLSNETILVDSKEEIVPEVVEKVEEPAIEIVGDSIKYVGITGEDTNQVSNEVLGEIWNKFVDSVIVPTLTSCMEKIKNYIEDVVANDLKKIDPTNK